MNNGLVINFLKLFEGFAFFRLRGKSLAHFQWTFPCVFFVFGVAINILFSEFFFVFSVEFFEDVRSIFGILTGFSIASLAAIATFKNPNLSNFMANDGVFIVELVGVSWEKRQISRREFLCIIFGYLSFVSLIIILLSSMFDVLCSPQNTSHESAIDACYLNGFSRIWFLPYVWLLCSAVVVKLLGLHYLIYRMHRP